MVGWLISGSSGVVANAVAEESEASPGAYSPDTNIPGLVGVVMIVAAFERTKSPFSPPHRQRRAAALGTVTTDSGKVGGEEGISAPLQIAPESRANRNLRLGTNSQRHGPEVGFEEICRDAHNSGISSYTISQKPAS